MRKDLISFKPIYSTFLSCSQDILNILKILFIETKPYSNILKRLLIINSRDCLDLNNQDYEKVINNISLKDMIDKGYIRLNPKISRGTHEEIKSYIIVTLDNFSPNLRSNHYRDYNINFDIVCYNDAWVLNDYKLRPLSIVGYIDGILNSATADNPIFEKDFQSKIKLSGIGEYEFLGCNEVVLNEEFSMYSLSYRGSHFTEDIQKIGQVRDY